MPAEGLSESGGLSRALFEVGEDMAKCRDIAPQTLRKGSERSGLGFERKPGDQCARLGGHSHAAGRVDCAAGSRLERYLDAVRGAL